MKNLLLGAVLALTLGTTVQAQSEIVKKEPVREKLTHEQRNSLKVKKMALDLDLNENQTKQLTAIYNDRSKEVETFKNTSKSEKAQSTEKKFETKSKILDKQIAFQNKVKNILTPEQFATWKASQKATFKQKAKKDRNMFKKDSARVKGRK